MAKILYIITIFCVGCSTVAIRPLKTQTKTSLVLNDEALIIPPQESITMNAGLPPRETIIDSPLPSWSTISEIRLPAKTNMTQVRVGEDQYLTLKSTRVMVSIEGMRARTIVDHLFFNPHKRVVEGEFFYTLPSHSSICYFAFYPEGIKQNVTMGDKRVSLPALPLATAMYGKSVEKYFEEEPSRFGSGKIAYAVPKEKARYAYEETVRRQVDPALVEWVASNTFRARVFPIQRQSYHRIVIAYEETLPVVDNVAKYRFALNDTQTDFLLVSDKSYVQDSMSNIEKVEDPRSNFVSYHFASGSQTIDEVIFSGTLKKKFIVGKDQETTYFYGSISPQFPLSYAPRSSKAVFVVDTSLSQESSLEQCISLVDKILAKSPEIKHFNVLFFDIACGWLQPGWIENRIDQRWRLREKTNNLTCEGATDIANALTHMLQTPWLNNEPKVDVFLLCNGEHNWGEVSLAKAVDDFVKDAQFHSDFFCYDFGAAENRNELFDFVDAFTTRTFRHCREKDLEKLAVAHREQPMSVTDISLQGICDFITAKNIQNLHHGQQIIVAGKVTGNCPTITISGYIAGQQRQFDFVVDTSKLGKLAPRAFGELAVQKMEELDEPALYSTITSFCRYFSIAGKTCSLLMLESQQDYDRFDIDLSKDGQSVQETQVAKQITTIEKRSVQNKESSKSKVTSIYQTLLKHGYLKPHNKVKEILDILTEEDFAIVREKMVHHIYSGKANEKDYLKRAQQYLEVNDDMSGYLRILSSVVEQNPHRKTYNNIGHLLLKKNMLPQAIFLFLRSCEKYPIDREMYLDLARSYRDLKKYGVAALYYQIALEQQHWWEKTIQPEYCKMLQDVLFDEDIDVKRRAFFQVKVHALKNNVENEGYAY
ncbi:VIT and vWA domain-containing protein [Candidatus Uabimicrobium amorphum]|uniref:VIT domain-containing protein n=1 Tax=Uabimicrobium amorphum TaxID=2596890 RepID=A0A5S9IR50_UABAM|nr:VIT and VWA domain-containing protein [Candidatus Uabimicrobium amorphum]BBM86593.1 hypothetical protein UABAM_04979 [Candidatus Uabimicrobium amorphum]